MRDVTLKRCIVGAYVSDGIGFWVDPIGPIPIVSDHRPGRQPIGDKALMAMLQTLLAERFKLVLHRESRRGETMVLEVARRGQA